jgi:hypothetical protein
VPLIRDDPIPLRQHYIVPWGLDIAPLAPTPPDTPTRICVPIDVLDALIRPTRIIDTMEVIDDDRAFIAFG